MDAVSTATPPGGSCSGSLGGPGSRRGSDHTPSATPILVRRCATTAAASPSTAHATYIVATFHRRRLSLRRCCGFGALATAHRALPVHLAFATSPSIRRPDPALARASWRSAELRGRAIQLAVGRAATNRLREWDAPLPAVCYSVGLPASFQALKPPSSAGSVSRSCAELLPHDDTLTDYSQYPQPLAVPRYRTSRHRGSGCDLRNSPRSSLSRR